MNTYKIVSVIVYLPIIIVMLIITIVKMMLIKKKHQGVTFITPQTAYLLNVNKCMSAQYRGYNILRFKECSLLLYGLVLTDANNKNIIVGCDVDNWSSETLDYVMLHEIGHHESTDGFSNIKLWWNIEDHLREGIYATFTKGEIAADRWAFENGADPKVAIRFLINSWWLSPITNTIRIFHAWRYMKNK